MVTESAFGRVAEIQKKVGVILTGGALVQILSRGFFLTADVDLVLAPNESEEGAIAALRKLGFIQKGAYWLDEAGDDIYQLIPQHYRDRTRKVKYAGDVFEAVAFEYIIADRLLGCSRGDRRMCEQALYLLKEFGKKVDREYLQELMEQSEVDRSFLSESKLRRLARPRRER